MICIKTICVGIDTNLYYIEPEMTCIDVLFKKNAKLLISLKTQNIILRHWWGYGRVTIKNFKKKYKIFDQEPYKIVNDV